MDKNELVYWQVLEGVRWLARSSRYSTSEILDSIMNDILSGKFEKATLDQPHRFWE